MKTIKYIIVSINIVIITIIFTLNPQTSYSAQEERKFDAQWIPCEMFEPPHYLNYCTSGSTYTYCALGPCGMMLD